MNSEQLAAASTIDKYFHKAASIDSVQAKWTHNFDIKKPSILSQPKKNYIQPKLIQESAMKSPLSKQKKSKDSQFTWHVTTLIKNLSDDFDKANDDNFSISDTEVLTAIIDNSNSIQSKPQFQSHKPIFYQRSLTLKGMQVLLSWRSN